MTSTAASQCEIFEEDVLKWILGFLYGRKYWQAVRVLEKETGVTATKYPEPIAFLRRLLYDGQWSLAMNFLDQCGSVCNHTQYKQMAFLVLKQQFLELLSFEPGLDDAFAFSANMTADPVSERSQHKDTALIAACLRAIENVVPSRDAFVGLCHLVTLSTLAEHPEYKKWTPLQGRHKLFLDLLPTMLLILGYPEHQQNHEPEDCSIEDIESPELKDRLLSLIYFGIQAESDSAFLRKSTGLQLTFVEKKAELVGSDVFSVNVFPSSLAVDNSYNNLLSSTKAPLTQVSGDPKTLFATKSVPSHALTQTLSNDQSNLVLLRSSAPNGKGGASLKQNDSQLAAPQKHNVRSEQGLLPTQPPTNDNHTSSNTQPQNKNASLGVQKSTPVVVDPKSQTSKKPSQPEASEIATNVKHRAPSIRKEGTVSGDRPLDPAINILLGNRSPTFFTEPDQGDLPFEPKPTSSHFLPVQSDALGPGKTSSPVPSLATATTPTHVPFQPPQIRDGHGIKNSLSSIPDWSQNKGQDQVVHFQRHATLQAAPIPERKPSLTNEKDVSKVAKSVTWEDMRPDLNNENQTETDLEPRCTPVAFIEDIQAIRSVAFHPLRDLLAVGSNSHTLRVCSTHHLRTGKTDISDRFDESEEKQNISEAPVLFKKKKYHKGSIYCLDWNAAGNIIASGSNDKTLQLLGFDVDSYTEVSSVSVKGAPGTIRDLLFASPNSSFNGVICSSENEILLFDVQKASLLHTMKAEEDQEPVSAIHACGDTLVSGHGASAMLRSWDLRAKVCVRQIDLKGNIASVAFDREGKYVVCGFQDGHCAIYDYIASKLLYKFEPHEDECRSVRFSSSHHSYLLSSSYDGSIALTRMFSREISSYIVAHHTDKVIQVRWHPHLHAFASSSADRTVKLWSLDRLL